MSACATIVVEIVKLIIQLVGALGIAWLTVRWALGRHKREKIWEYRFRSYTDLVASLGDLLDVIGDQEERALGFEQANRVPVEELKTRHHASRRRLGEIRAVAGLTLGKEIADVLDTLARDIARHDNTQFQDWHDEINDEHRLVLNARDLIVKLGRADLELKND